MSLNYQQLVIRGSKWPQAYHKQILVIGTDATVITTNFEFLVNSIFENNQAYAPSDLDGDIWSDPGQGRKDLAAFNAAGTNSGNTESDPSWTDPENGDFT